MLKSLLKFGLTICKEVIKDCIGFENIFRPKKLLKLAILALFGDFSAENLSKTEVGT